MMKGSELHGGTSLFISDSGVARTCSYFSHGDLMDSTDTTFKMERNLTLTLQSP